MSYVDYLELKLQEVKKEMESIAPTKQKPIKRLKKVTKELRKPRKLTKADKHLKTKELGAKFKIFRYVDSYLEDLVYIRVTNLTSQQSAITSCFRVNAKPTILKLKKLLLHK